MLLEEFKQCLPERMVLYLNEQKVVTVPQGSDVGRRICAYA